MLVAVVTGLVTGENVRWELETKDKWRLEDILVLLKANVMIDQGVTRGLGMLHLFHFSPNFLYKPLCIILASIPGRYKFYTPGNNARLFTAYTAPGQTIARRWF